MRLSARALKELGIAPQATSASDQDQGPAPLPRIVVRRARGGYCHPAGRADIQNLLRFFGETCTYGVRAVELRQGSEVAPAGGLALGKLVVPGRVVLFDQPPSPWLLSGLPSAAELERLRGAGAMPEIIPAIDQTRVIWPGDTLRDFMLFDVLMHEIGHHLLQHHKGKRRERVARTADHEARANRFALRCRMLYFGDRGMAT